AWNLVEEYYVDREAVQPQRMTDGAILGMLDSLGDIGHTTYLTTKQYEQMTTNLHGDFTGIGARMTMRDRTPTIFSVIPHSPAAAKLKPGDVLLEVDGKPVHGLSVDEIVNMIRGKVDTEVHLRISRQGTQQDVTIVRATFKVPAITGRLLPRLKPGDPLLAHVAIENFGDRADAQLRNVLGEVRAKGAQGLVVDLRGDGGGERDQAVSVTSEFLPKGKVIFQQKNARGGIKPVLVPTEGTALTIPIVVLIDGGTASSAEILAAAIKDNDRGRLVGQPTFGTGTVLGQFQLSDGSAVLLAIEEWLTPNGQSIWHKGIEPDIKVSLPKDALVLLPETEEGLTAEGLAHSSDAQLLAAIHALTEKMRKK
ncbi:MAG TPA: S41 family peptidase, partial [Gemmataceae bacterium]|nr:S41 family peptidase [Gemmataceae bacterium]